ncbi:PAS domain S-box protein, partial [Thermodesulfobacteriota bacterium]
MTINNNSAPNSDRTDEPLYNSLLIRNYIYYLTEYYPSININSVLKDTGITKLEIEDHGHWFSQHQVDRFYDTLLAKTGNSNIARDAGRYAASPKVFSTLSQYVLGFITPSNAYRMVEKGVSNVSRGFTFQTRKLTGNRWEAKVTLEPGVKERPYQCENRTGMLEAVAKLFTGEYATIEHPSCFHKGDDICVYIVSWQKTLSLKWRIIRNYTILLSSILSVILFFFLPVIYWLIILLFCGLLSSSIYIYSQNLWISDMVKTVETQGDAANDLLSEMNTRHENALLIQEIGQATSTILDIHNLFDTVTSVMEKHLEFDRGMIMIPDENKTSLFYTSGYGYDKDYETLLRKTSFSLKNPQSKGMAVQSFKHQKPFQINDISKIENNLSEKSIEFVKQIGAKSFICVPIVYEKEALGILAVDNVNSKKPFTQSDISLLMGVASLTAVSIINAMSFNKLQESEKEYRELVETANSIILRMDLMGKITFFNNFAQKFFGYSEDEIIGMNVKDTILPKADIEQDAIEHLVKILQKDPEKRVVDEAENILKNGELKWVTWTFNPIFDSDHTMKEILCIGNDITPLKIARQEKDALEGQLQVSQKMEAVGTLAGGIAHDFNNILQAILSNIQVLMMSKNLDESQKSSILSAVERSVERASDLTRRLLLFSRKVESDLRPIDLSQEVEHVVKMLERTIPKMINIELNIDQNLSFINADPSQIEQILMNLAINSR